MILFNAVKSLIEAMGLKENTAASIRDFTVKKEKQS
jgi:hypothetical protein